MQNDTTASTIAKRKKLEEELAKAIEDLHETEYDHSIEAQKDALQKQFEDYQDTREKEIEELEATLEDRESILYESFESVKANAAIIGEEIEQIASEHGVKVSESLTSAWKAGEKAIASYGQTLSAKSSQFISNIKSVESNVWKLQSQANATAISLAQMFSVRSDRLVNELNSSYTSEQNLMNMTYALRDSLVNTLERGYDVSGVVGAFNSITNAANETKVAADAAKASLDALNATPTNTNTGGGEHIIHTGGGNFRDDFMLLAASGVRKTTKDQPAITDEAGVEIKRLPDGAIMWPVMPSGTTVFNNEQTQRLWELSKDPSVLSRMVGNYDRYDELTKSLTPKIEIPAVNRNSNNTMSIGSLVTVQGNVNDSMEMLKIASQTAAKEVKKGFKELNKGIYK